MVAKKWTAEEDAELRRLFEDEGLTLEVIGQRMGKSRGAVSSRASRLSYKSPNERGSWSTAEALGLKSAPATVKKSKTPKAATSNVEGRVASNKKKPPKYYRETELLPYLVTKEGTLLHVYARDPYAQMPLVTYERRGVNWVSRKNPSVKFQTIHAAVGAVGV